MIMESVPNRRAGMGSGVNDAGREVGGVLGIAVLGSLLATAYHAGLHGLLGALHPRDAEGARRSIGGALRSRSTSAASAAPRSPTEPAPRSSTGCNSPCVESVAVR
jgi:DHA2 family multidrug resistance protein-like MFS transporter